MLFYRNIHGIFDMKTVKLLIPLLFLTAVVKAQLPTTELFEHYVLKTDPTPAPAGYGLTAAMPIPVGAYVEDLADEKKINHQLSRFFKTLQWADGSPMVYVSRSSGMINNINIDQFRVTKVGSKDTVTLFTDLYKSEPIHAPQGFKFYTKEQMAAELAPVLTQIKTYNAIPDKYADTTAKKETFIILGFLQSQVGIDFLMDKDYLDPIINDMGVDTDFKAYLIRSYLFHKFEAEATGQADVKIKAYNAMVDDYQDVISKHDIFSKGSLATLMVKK